MELSHDGRTLWAVSPGYGRVVGDRRASREGEARLPVRSRRATTKPRPRRSPRSHPTGRSLAVAVGNELWLVSTARRTVVKAKPHAQVALGYSPDGSKLWAVLNGNRVVALPVA